MRGLSDNFKVALKSGLLKPILDRVRSDDTLMLSIRDGYINIYYRGGNIIKITEMGEKFNLFFDKNYDLNDSNKKYLSLMLPELAGSISEINEWINSFSILKDLMDLWFSKNPKLEREFQQLVERENNRSSLSGETEYFITDIEFADSNIGARFDILAIKWLASKRKSGKNCKASFIEMKYGDKALSGESGLVKHLSDINNFLEPQKNNYSAILEVMNTQFNQLDELGLISYNHSVNETKVQLSVDDKPEFIFLLANHNPRSTKLKSILSSSEFRNLIRPELYDLRFFVCSDAGYGMHSSNMITYEEYLSRI